MALPYMVKCFIKKVNPFCIAKGSTLKFDTTVTNYGGAYSTSTGYYTCPSTGVYVFHLAIQNLRSKYFHVDLKKGSYRLLQLYVGGSSSDFHSAAGTAICYCSKGSTVRAIVSPTSNDAYIHDDGQSRFSGFKLHA